MNWQDEPFIKWYTRPTPEFLALSIAARGLLPLILAVVDRAGILKVGKLGLRGLAVALHCSWLEIETAVAELVGDGRIVFDEERGAVLIPNHIEAQAASQSDVARQRRSRETARSLIGATRPDVTKRDGALTERDSSVTKRDRMSRPVTSGHVESRDVTLEETRSEETRRDESPRDASATPPPLAPKSSKGTRIPDGWQPNASTLAWCRTKRIAPKDIERVVERMSIWFQGQSGAKGVKGDWDKTLQSWVLREIDEGKIAQTLLATRPDDDLPPEKLVSPQKLLELGEHLSRIGSPS